MLDSEEEDADIPVQMIISDESEESEQDDVEELVSECSDDSEGDTTSFNDKGVVSQESSSSTGESQQTLPGTFREEIHLDGIDVTNVTPWGVLHTFLTDEIFDFLVERTNSNANQKKQSLTNSPTNLDNWTDTTRNELKLFLGLRLWMGLVRMPSLRYYWSENPMYSNNVARNVMSKSRFQMLLRFCYVRQDIEKLLDLLNAQFWKMKTPGDSLIIYESVVPWHTRSRNRLCFLEQQRDGVIILKLHDKSGYTYGIMESRNSVTTEALLKFVDPYVGSGRTFYTSNASVDLATACLDRRTHLIGTVKNNDRNLPNEILSKKLEKGNMIFLKSAAGVSFVKWEGESEMYLLSTKHTAESKAKTKRKGENLIVPKVIVDYNNAKISSELFISLSSQNTAIRKMSKWYHNVAEDTIFTAAVVNAFLVFDSFRMKKTKLEDFRQELVMELLSLPNHSIVRNMKRDNHYLEQVSTKQGNRKTRNRCRMCYERLTQTEGRSTAIAKTKRVSTVCSICPDKPFLCIPCFEPFHNRKKWK